MNLQLIMGCSSLKTCLLLSGRDLFLFFYSDLSLFRLSAAEDSVYRVVTVCSELSSRTPEASLEMEREAATSARSSPAHQWLCGARGWGHRHSLPRARKGAGQGKLRPAAWAGEETESEPRRRYLTESREELRQTRAKLSGAISAPQPVDSDTLSLTQHGSDLDPVRSEAEKRQCQVQSSGYAQRGQLQLLILSCKYFLYIFYLLP